MKILNLIRVAIAVSLLALGMQTAHASCDPRVLWLETDEDETCSYIEVGVGGCGSEVTSCSISICDGNHFTFECLT